ncbi:MAG: LLM class flavin-dependent oxidoreductase [Pseudomonadales bacterium]|nr:LLM class flavin-dependent oxidoreductase [Pseudomonadales bacterium]
MPVRQRIALTLPDPRGVAQTLEIAKWGEAEGYDDLWFSDSNGVDALTTAAAVALQTERCRIGTAIIPVFSRTPAVLASTAHVLHQLSNGRFILGLGSSSQVMMENWHGQVFEKPLSRVKETTQLIKQMLNGEKTNFSGNTVASHGYRQLPLANDVQPVFMAALRGKMLETAAEFSDGVILNLFPKNSLPQMMEHIKIGAERAGKKIADVEIVCRHQVVVTDDKAGARDMIRAGFAPYYATPVYNAFLHWSGYPEVAEKISQGWAAKDRVKTNSALDDQLVDDIAILGTKEACQDRIREYADMGITTHIIACVSAKEMQQTFDAFSGNHFSF